MKTINRSLTAATLLLVNSVGFADENQTLETRFAQLLERTEMLQNEVKSLRSELHAVKAKANTPTAAAPQSNKKIQIKTKSIYDKDAQPSDSEHTIVAAGQNKTYLAGAPVIASPFLGNRSDFEDNDLIVRISKINFDLRLLEQRQKLAAAMLESGIDIPDHPIIELSGKVVFIAGYDKPRQAPGQSTATLASAELAAVAEINPWITGTLNLLYSDNVKGVDTGNGFHNRRLYTDKAFITIGNLNESPLYLTMGRAYAPFGRYSSEMVSSPLTENLGRTWTEYVQVGYRPQATGFYGSVYTFKPSVGVNTSRMAGGFDIGFDTAKGAFSSDTSVSFISSIANAKSFQFSGGGVFAGFGASKESQRLVHHVPAISVRHQMKYDRYGLIAEAVVPTRAFNVADLGHMKPGGTMQGARPYAVVIEGTIDLQTFGQPWTLAAGYSWSDQAYALGLPKQRYQLSMATALWRDTLQVLELRHEKNYAAGTGGCGRTATTGGDSNCAALPLSTGKSSTGLFFLFGAYF